MAEPLSERKVVSLSEAQGEQPWLRERRVRAWRAFERMPMPDARSGYWQHTDLRDLDLNAYSPANGGPAVQTLDALPRDLAGAFADPEQSQAVLIEWNDRPLHRPSQEVPDCKGFVFTDLHTALGCEFVRDRFMTDCLPPEAGKFVALHGAFSAAGAFVYVPAGFSVKVPLRAVHGLAGEGAAIFPHTLIVAEAGSELTFVDEYYGGNGSGLCAAAVEIFVGDGARLRYASVQGLGAQAYHFCTMRVLMGRESEFESLVVSLGSKLSRSEAEAVLAGEGGKSEMFGLTLASGEQRLDNRTLQHHAARHTRSDLLYKAAVGGSSRSVYGGNIRVDAQAQNADAYQASRNLILDEGARAHSIPTLEILANDVRCTHGATVGRLDDEQVFYLASRGIDREQAERLLVRAFLDDIMMRVSDESLRGRIEGAVEAKLTAA